MKQLHITGSASLSRGSVRSRGLVLHTLAPSNRDQNRNFQNGTVTKTGVASELLAIHFAFQQAVDYGQLILE